MEGVVIVFYTIEQLRLDCAPELDAHARRELFLVLSAFIGPSRDCVPLNQRAYDRRLAQLQATIIATRKRFLRLDPECLFIVVHGRTTNAKHELQQATLHDLARVTELHITPIGEES